MSLNLSGQLIKRQLRLNIGGDRYSVSILPDDCFGAEVTEQAGIAHPAPPHVRLFERGVFRVAYPGHEKDVVDRNRPSLSEIADSISL
jgi:hypothetical protein